jgi:hypothetical protein
MLLYYVNSVLFSEGLTINYLIARRKKLRRKITNVFRLLFSTVSCGVFLSSFLIIYHYFVLFAFRRGRSCSANTVHLMLTARAYSRCSIWRSVFFFRIFLILDNDKSECFFIALNTCARQTLASADLLNRKPFCTLRHSFRFRL